MQGKDTLKKGQSDKKKDFLNKNAMEYLRVGWGEAEEKSQEVE